MQTVENSQGSETMLFRNNKTFQMEVSLVIHARLKTEMGNIFHLSIYLGFLKI